MSGTVCPGTQDVPAIDEKIAALLGTETSNLMVTDLAVYPQTGNTFVSVMRGRGDAAVPVLLRVDGAGQLQVVDLGQLPYTRVRLPNPPGENTPLVLPGGAVVPRGQLSEWSGHGRGDEHVRRTDESPTWRMLTGG